MKSKETKFIERDKHNISIQERKFFDEIVQILQTARSAAFKAINTVMVQTYWNIGKRIVEQEQGGKVRADYGDFFITNLSRYLTDIFGRGFSEANLWNFRQFYSVFPQFSTQRVENLSRMLEPQTRKLIEEMGNKK